MSNIPVVNVPVVLSPTIPIGTRVGVYQNSFIEEGKKILIFVGYALYEGEFPYRDTTINTPITNMQQKIDIYLDSGRLVLPRFRFEDGTALFTYEIFWETVERIEELKFHADEVVEVSPADIEAQNIERNKELYALAWRELEYEKELSKQNIMMDLPELPSTTDKKLLN